LAWKDIVEPILGAKILVVVSMCIIMEVGLGVLTGIPQLVLIPAPVTRTTLRALVIC
jgi:hypothetical protein